MSVFGIQEKKKQLLQEICAVIPEQDLQVAVERLFQKVPIASIEKEGAFLKDIDIVQKKLEASEKQDLLKEVRKVLDAMKVIFDDPGRYSVTADGVLFIKEHAIEKIVEDIPQKYKECITEWRVSFTLKKEEQDLLIMHFPKLSWQFLSDETKDAIFDIPRACLKGVFEKIPIEERVNVLQRSVPFFLDKMTYQQRKEVLYALYAIPRDERGSLDAILDFTRCYTLLDKKEQGPFISALYEASKKDFEDIKEDIFKVYQRGSRVYGIAFGITLFSEKTKEEREEYFAYTKIHFKDICSVLDLLKLKKKETLELAPEFFQDGMSDEGKTRVLRSIDALNEERSIILSYVRKFICTLDVNVRGNIMHSIARVLPERREKIVASLLVFMEKYTLQKYSVIAFLINYCDTAYEEREDFLEIVQKFYHDQGAIDETDTLVLIGKIFREKKREYLDYTVSHSQNMPIQDRFRLLEEVSKVSNISSIEYAALFFHDAFSRYDKTEIIKVIDTLEEGKKERIIRDARRFSLVTNEMHDICNLIRSLREIPEEYRENTIEHLLTLWKKYPGKLSSWTLCRIGQSIYRLSDEEKIILLKSLKEIDLHKIDSFHLGQIISMLQPLTEEEQRKIVARNKVYCKDLNGWSNLKMMEALCTSKITARQENEQAIVWFHEDIDVERRIEILQAIDTLPVEDIAEVILSIETLSTEKPSWKYEKERILGMSAFPRGLRVTLSEYVKKLHLFEDYELTPSKKNNFGYMKYVSELMVSSLDVLNLLVQLMHVSMKCDESREFFDLFLKIDPEERLSVASATLKVLDEKLPIKDRKELVEALYMLPKKERDTAATLFSPMKEWRRVRNRPPRVVHIHPVTLNFIFQGKDLKTLTTLLGTKQLIDRLQTELCAVIEEQLRTGTTAVSLFLANFVVQYQKWLAIDQTHSLMQSAMERKAKSAALEDAVLRQKALLLFKAMNFNGL